MSVERLILSGLLHDEDYARKVVPFLRPEYFVDRAERVVYGVLDAHFNRYNVPATRESALVDLDAVPDLNETTFAAAREVVEGLTESEQNRDWLVDQTERFCQDRAVYNAVMTAIEILNEKKDVQGKPGKGAIPQILQDALAVSFDSRIGHDFLDDAEQRYEFYHTKQKRIPFDIEYLNKITDGGLPSKTLSAILAGTNVGKSLVMCHMAAANLSAGFNVLYITLEMSEERISERIDANLLDVSIKELSKIPRDAYMKKVDRLRTKTTGRLIVKEYPTVGAGSANFRHLLNELKIKKNFRPDIVYIDYLNICASSRLKMGPSVNSYTYVKAIAEELRGLAVEMDVPIVTATQTNRAGSTNSDVGMDETSESFGLPMTLDLMFALISTEELEKLGQYMVKQLKNRFADVSYMRKFVIGVDRTRMRLYDVEPGAQTLINDSPVMDSTDFGSRVVQERDFELGRSTASKFDRKKAFEGFS